MVERATSKCRLNLPQSPLIPYTEPKVEDGSILDQAMLDLLDNTVEEAAAIYVKKFKFTGKS